MSCSLVHLHAEMCFANYFLHYMQLKIISCMDSQPTHAVLLACEKLLNVHKFIKSDSKDIYNAKNAFYFK